MTSERTLRLLANLDSLVERETDSNRQQIASMLELVQSLRDSSPDRRLMLLVSLLGDLRERLDVLSGMIRSDYLDKLEHEAGMHAAESPIERAAAVVRLLATSRPLSISAYCETLLDELVRTTGAERGFVLFYLPESTEANIVAARAFETTNLSLEEYGFSRTIVRAVLERREPVMLDDAASDPRYGREASVHRLSLRSVLAVPLEDGSRTIGTVYLENNSAPKVFGPGDALVAEMAARVAVLRLSAARLVPKHGRDSRVLLDPSRASSEIVGNDPAIRSILETVERIADSPATVFIEGESGTGKELIARALHYRSSRRDRAFVAINCAAIPEHLLESELFGHERGAFTGAVERRRGMLELGDGGTVFLDEISELAYRLQAKLLRFLQSREMLRLGGTEMLRPDVRIVVATSKDLREMMLSGGFQDALYYRIHVVPIAVPPLRNRRGDITGLVDHFLSRYSAMYGRTVGIDADALSCMNAYSWPGNVREVENVAHRLVALAVDDTIRVGDLPEEILGEPGKRVSLGDGSFAARPRDFDELRMLRAAARRHFANQERRLAEAAVRQADGNVTEAAARLGMHRVTLHKLLRKTEE